MTSPERQLKQFSSEPRLRCFLLSGPMHWLRQKGGQSAALPAYTTIAASVDVCLQPFLKNSNYRPLVNLRLDRAFTPIVTLGSFIKLIQVSDTAAIIKKPQFRCLYVYLALVPTSGKYLSIIFFVVLDRIVRSRPSIDATCHYFRLLSRYCHFPSALLQTSDPILSPMYPYTASKLLPFFCLSTVSFEIISSGSDHSQRSCWPPRKRQVKPIGVRRTAVSQLTGSLAPARLAHEFCWQQ